MRVPEYYVKIKHFLWHQIKLNENELSYNKAYIYTYINKENVLHYIKFTKLILLTKCPKSVPNIQEAIKHRKDNQL